MNNIIDKQKGITLISLVITIIILLILAGISIATLTGNGLFEKAKLAENKTKELQDKENHILQDYENQINQLGDFSDNGDNIMQFEGNLVSYWPLKDSLENEKSEDNDLVVYSGNNAKFEEDSIYINSTVLATENNYLLPEKFTIIFKYKPSEELKPWTLIFGKHIGYMDNKLWNGIGIDEDFNKGSLYCGFSEVDYYEINELLKVGEYSTIAITYDGISSKLYSNSKLVIQREGWSDVKSSLFIGGCIYSGKNVGAVDWKYANGYFKDIRIYDIALDEQYLK